MYMQVCAQQYKPELAHKAFDRMLSLGIQPTDHIYTQLQQAYAKTRNLEKVLELHEEARVKYGIEPSVNRMNTLIVAYCRTGKLLEAEDLMRDMRENMGLIPDVVCYTSLIDGHAKAENFERCWEIYQECMEKELDGQDIDEQMMGMMIRLCSKSKNPQKAIRIFNEL